MTASTSSTTSPEHRGQWLAWLSCLAIGVLAYTWSAPSPQGPDPTGSDDVRAGQLRDHDVPPEGYMMVVAYGKKGEVGRWDGAVDERVMKPTRFIATRGSGKKKWTWKPELPEPPRIDMPGRNAAASNTQDDRSQSVDEWARKLKAHRVVVIVVPHPGEPEDGASRTGMGTQGMGSGRDSESSSRPDEDAAVASRHVDTRAEVGSDSESEHEVGTTSERDEVDAEIDAEQEASAQGERGTGPGRGQHGSDANDGLGNEQGRSRGYDQGSTQPSRVQNKRADLTTERGGHTPGDGGKRHGSAGGTEGATGNIHGSGWFALIDAPEDVAPLVSAGLIIIDANVLGFGHKMLSRVVRGMGVRALRKELEKDAARIVAHDLVKVRDKLSRSQHYFALPSAERQAIIKRAESAMTRAYFAKSKKLLSEKADTFDQLAAKYANHTDEVDKHIHTLATENAAAYRQMASAADAEHARLAAAAPTKSKPKLLGPKKSTKIVRKTPGTAIGGHSLKPASGKWLRGTHQNAAPLPKQVADALRGRKFKSWDDMRREVWKTVAADKTLHGPFDAYDLKRMRAGNAPRVQRTQAVGELNVYVLHHPMPIQHGGGVYDLDNIVVVTPRYHKEVLDSSYHMGSRRK